MVSTRVVKFGSLASGECQNTAAKFIDSRPIIEGHKVINYPAYTRRTLGIGAFFDDATNTISYIVKDPTSDGYAIIDSAMDLGYAATCITYDHVNERDCMCSSPCGQARKCRRTNKNYEARRHKKRYSKSTALITCRRTIFD